MNQKNYDTERYIKVLEEVIEGANKECMKYGSYIIEVRLRERIRSREDRWM
jgi:hypothetical protein